MENGKWRVENPEIAFAFPMSVPHSPFSILNSQFSILTRWLLVVLVSVGAGGCASSGVKIEPVYFPPPPALPHVVHLTSFNSLNGLVPARHSWVEFFRGAAPSPHVRTPGGLAFSDGCLYLCDTGFGVVHRWDLRTGKAKKFGVHGEPTLVKPVDVALDGAGNVYVADRGLAAVVAFSPDGAFLRRFKAADRKDYRPVAVAVCDSQLYVADIGAHRVDVFSTADGASLGSFGGTGKELGRFFYPMGLAVTGDGHICVADMMNSRVQVFDTEHNPVLSFGKPGNRYGDMGQPKRLAVGPDGVVFVADVDFAHIHMFDLQGRLLMLFGGTDESPGGTPLPVGITVTRSLPSGLAALVPADFHADYFLFVANSVGTKRISLYAVGTAR